MKILLDQGLPRGTAAILRADGWDVLHTGECGLARATDAAIIEFARAQNRMVVTLDADFHVLLALDGSMEPSVVRIRVERLRSEAAARIIRSVVQQCEEDLDSGAAVSVDAHRTRVRRLPIGPHASRSSDE